jgi:hypothetical protein
MKIKKLSDAMDLDNNMMQENDNSE